MDNATVHKDPEVVELIKATGAELIWCAAYSPDLNPIERCFAQLKAFLQRNGRYFPNDQMYLHHLALSRCTTPANMRHYYMGSAFCGNIRNVPKDVPRDMQAASGPDVAVLLALGIVPGAYS